MENQQIEPTKISERIDLLDVLRGLAVCGIFIGNLQWFSGYGFMPATIAVDAPLADRVTQFLVHFFIEGKFYSIFSFLFGFGFALQIANAKERGDTKASLFKRRLFWLFVIGLLHASLLWYGDILSVYALMGFLLVLFRNKNTESLLKWAFGLIVLPIFTFALLFVLFKAFVPAEQLAGIDDAQVNLWKSAVESVPQSSYFQIFSGYNLQLLAGRWAGLFLQMRLPKILAMFLIGFYVYRRGYLQNLSENRQFLRRAAIYGLLIGTICNIVFAATAHSEADFPPTIAAFVGVVAYAFGVPAMALGIIGLIATLWQSDAVKRILTVFAPVGRMALSNYLLQTIVGVTIFYGYGLRQFGKFGALSATLLALGVFAVQIILSRIWLSYFNYGPMEWIWRQLTYGRRLRLRIQPSHAAADSAAPAL